jgi:predicted acylesterase/phospholipase RssA
MINFQRAKFLVENLHRFSDRLLERKNIPIDLIAGTCVGALIGAADATNSDATALENALQEFLVPKSPPNGRHKFSIYTIPEVKKNSN